MLRPVEPPESRCRWVGEGPASFSESDCIREITEYGHPMPEKVLVRTSTGTLPGSFAMAYFATAGDAELFMAGGMKWSGCGRNDQVHEPLCSIGNRKQI